MTKRLPGASPVMSYWKQTRILSDTRLAAQQNDTLVHAFTAPSSGEPISVPVELCFGRAFQTMLDIKGGSTPDIMMEKTQVALITALSRRVFLPLLMR